MLARAGHDVTHVKDTALGGHLDELSNDLDAGAIVVFTNDSIRIRRLPRST